MGSICSTTDTNDPAVQEVLLALETLRTEVRTSSPAALPIKPHDLRLPSGDRGVSLAFLAAIGLFYERHGGVSLAMGDICKGEGEHVTVCALTLSTGLSLAESVAHVAERDGLLLARGAVSRARGFFSYSWTGTALVDMLAAIEDVVRPLEALSVGGGERHVWVDMFCASQNLLAGVYRSPSVTKESDPAGYLARKEDTDRIFDDALEAVSEVYFYCSPLVGEWDAPPHPFLSPQRDAKGAPAQPWVRRGAAAITRAWCLFELSVALGKKCKLHVALSRADCKAFGEMLSNEFDQIAGIVAAIDARDAQISKVEDRGYILGRIEALAPGAADAEAEGLSHVTARVSEALRGWLVASAREELGRLAPAERATSVLINSCGRLLYVQGDLPGAEALYLEAVGGRRDQLGDWHPDTLVSIHNLGRLLRAKGDLNGAEALLREAVLARRDVFGGRHPDTLASIEFLGTVLKAKGDLDGGEALLCEAVEGQREALGDRHPSTLHSINSLGHLLCDKGDIEGAEPLYREVLKGNRETLGDRHPDTLASIACLGMLLDDKGDLDGAAPLYREALDGTRETLGDRHMYTLGSIGNYADLLCRRDPVHPNRARTAMGDAPEVAREVLGADHPVSLLIEAQAARIGIALGVAGRTVLRQVVARMEAVLGPEHPQTRKYKLVCESAAGRFGGLLRM